MKAKASRVERKRHERLLKSERRWRRLVTFKFVSELGFIESLKELFDDWMMF